eukprot:TRINITY_DN12312_c0_g1_i1.p1 TRINITY_DN12312_c0_g1~~TRINITY_DN12312_c0_g1_i1.p1  ORF type:complete len:1003 (-),score=113.27 TRINITY_DN12312_c0_g1_i1:3-2984(-)
MTFLILLLLAWLVEQSDSSFATTSNFTCPIGQRAECIPYDVGCQIDCGPRAFCNRSAFLPNEGDVTYGTCQCGFGHVGSNCCPLGNSGVTCELCDATPQCAVRGCESAASLVQCQVAGDMRFSHLLDQFPGGANGTDAVLDLRCNRTSAVCLATIWAVHTQDPNRPVPVLDVATCSLTGCQLLSAASATYYRCNGTKCQCAHPSLCPTTVGSELGEARTNFEVRCFPNGTCELQQTELWSPSVRVGCMASRCGAPPPVPLPPGDEPIPMGKPSYLAAELTLIVIAVMAAASVTWICRSAAAERRHLVAEWLSIHEGDVLHIAGEGTSTPAPTPTPLRRQSTGAETTAESENEERNRLTFVCRNLAYTVRNKQGGGTRKVLEHIRFSLVSGDSLAIMGPERSGKTCLMDILGDRDVQGRVSGKVTLCGYNIKELAQYYTLCAYADDKSGASLFSDLTVAEHVQFAAAVRLPVGVLPEAHIRRVNELLDDLGLSPLHDTPIRMLSRAERTRVSIAAELIAETPILLLDDAFTCTDGIRAARLLHGIRMVQERHSAFRMVPPITILTFTHPTAEVFSAQFDKLLLLSAEGRQLFFGPAAEAAGRLIGTPSSSSLLATSSSSAGSAPGEQNCDENPAVAHVPESLLQLACERRAVTTAAAAAAAADVQEEAEDEARQGSPGATLARVCQMRERFAVGSLQQFEQLMRRYFQLLSRRDMWSLLLTWFTNCVCAILIALMFNDVDGCRQVPEGEECVPNLNGLAVRSQVFLLLLAWLALQSVPTITALHRDCAAVTHERGNECYGGGPYVFSTVIADVVIKRLTSCVLFARLVYIHPFPWYGLGLRSSFYHFSWFTGVLVLFTIPLHLGFACLAFLLSEAQAQACAVALVVVGLAVSGFVAPLPPGLLWLRYASLFTPAFEMLMVNEVSDQKIRYDPIIHAPAPWVPVNGTFESGNRYLHHFDLEIRNWWLDSMLLVTWTAAFLLAGWLLASARWLPRR